jgi:CelD/BcsL family acetyltransferase involved in cellulose biosynthesis
MENTGCLSSSETVKDDSRAPGQCPVSELPGKGASRPSIHLIDPLTDTRWNSFVQKHPRASIFHTNAWVNALHQTYGYKPVAYTTTPGGKDLTNGVIFCHVDSWLTGKRLVSLPFSDHCELLADDEQDLQLVAAELERQTRDGHCQYVELRPIRPLNLSTSLFRSTETYHFHQLNLTADLDTIFRNFHKDSIQRKIRRAEREGLDYREGSPTEHLDRFYRLFTITRQRHQVPPQPLNWFRNLIDNFGDDLKIRMAFKKGLPVASILTIRHKDTLVYKYGCSDVRYNSLGGMHLLFWNSIQEAKNAGLTVFDFGRCDSQQMGLITFKRRWGAAESILTYSRYASADNSSVHFPPDESSFRMRLAKQVFTRIPARCLPLIGSLLYKHVG